MTTVTSEANRITEVRELLLVTIKNTILPRSLDVDIDCIQSLEKLLGRLHDDPNLLKNSSKLRAILADYILLQDGYDIKLRVQP